MNPDLARLHPYPFQKLMALKEGITPPADLAPIAMSIGEPQHPTPSVITQALIAHAQSLSSYPLTHGTAELRQTICDWLSQRFAIPSSALQEQRHVIPVNGTREALFAFAQAVVNSNTNPLVLMPNPFYQIYEGAALLSGAEPFFLPTTDESGFLPDFDAVPAQIWQRCQLIYLCSPGNPSGAVMGREHWQRIIQLADEYDFIIAADECYSELYRDEQQAPIGLLQVAQEMGRNDFQRCVVFHSLSKRSNAPGLRSGFVAGDAAVLEKFLLYRTYHGCTLSPPVQAASIAAWRDEQHVRENRDLYRAKYAAVQAILNPTLPVNIPAASFYLWPETPLDDVAFARALYAQQNITVLPGSFLSRTVDAKNPGQRHIRIALVAPLEQCIEAAQRIKTLVESL